jgi:hypothetical protein
MKNVINRNPRSTIGVMSILKLLRIGLMVLPAPHIFFVGATKLISVIPVAL